MERRDFIGLEGKDGYQHRSHNKNLLFIHLIFVVKYRKKLLTGSVREDVMQYIYDICNKHHLYIRRMETDKDHIHMLIQFKPTDSITKIASMLKSYSTYHVWQKHGARLRKDFWKEKTFWSDGYFAATIGNASKETVEKYIKDQG